MTPSPICTIKGAERVHIFVVKFVKGLHRHSLQLAFSFQLKANSWRSWVSWIFLKTSSPDSSRFSQSLPRSSATDCRICHCEHACSDCFISYWNLLSEDIVNVTLENRCTVKLDITIFVHRSLFSNKTCELSPEMHNRYVSLFGFVHCHPRRLRSISWQSFGE